MSSTIIGAMKLKQCLWMGVFFFLSCAPKKFEPRYSTPEETFRTWRQAAENLDLPLLVSCYADTAKAKLRDDLSKTSKEGLAAMQEEAKETKFEIEKIVYERHRAYLRVKRSLDGSDEIEVVTMVKEGPNWKIIP